VVREGYRCGLPSGACALSSTHASSPKAQASADLRAQVEDFRAETEALNKTLCSLSAHAWARSTTFKSWAVWDVLAHLHTGNLMGLLTLNDPQAYARKREDNAASGLSRTELARQQLGDLSGEALRAAWYADAITVCERFVDADPDVRLTWSGPGMKPRMFVAARQMETWAHGTEIYDLFKLPREHYDRLRNIATLGVRTFAWTFRNRAETVPDEVPYVALTAPSGARWTWNDSHSRSRIEGTALDFCQVVTQVRNIADVGLSVHGESARMWMAKAQCFAGAPEDPPAPGSRV
jgi:uncharacterized protein (TIGR03084 family)